MTLTLRASDLRCAATPDSVNDEQVRRLFSDARIVPLVESRFMAMTLEAMVRSKILLSIPRYSETSIVVEQDHISAILKWHNDARDPKLLVVVGPNHLLLLDANYVDMGTDLEGTTGYKVW